MSREEHTPGPWEVVPLNGFGPFAIRMPTPAGTKQATHYGVGQIGTAANARLIAAAPELLSALKDAVGLLREEGWADGPTGRAALAAIAKAEGRT